MTIRIHTTVAIMDGDCPKCGAASGKPCRLLLNGRCAYWQQNTIAVYLASSDAASPAGGKAQDDQRG